MTSGSSTGLTTLWHSTPPQQHFTVSHLLLNIVAINALTAPALIPINVANSTSEKGSILKNGQMRQIGSVILLDTNIKSEYI